MHLEYAKPGDVFSCRIIGFRDNVTWVSSTQKHWPNSIPDSILITVTLILCGEPRTLSGPATVRFMTLEFGSCQAIADIDFMRVNFKSFE